MSFLRAVVERLAGSHALKDGHGFALGSILAADLPACNHSRDGEKRRIPGAAGVADREVTCEKNAADAYAWQEKGDAYLQATFLTAAEGDAAYVNVTGDTMTGNLTISKTVPAVILFETNAGADEKHWDWTAFGGDLYLVARSDDLGSSFIPLTLTRTGVSAVAATFGGSVAIGGGTAIAKVLSATATLDFGSIAAQTCSELTITVTGAVVNAAVDLGPPAAPEAGVSWCGRVSATDTVTVRLCNVTTAAIDPASATWRAKVTNF